MRRCPRRRLAGGLSKLGEVGTRCPRGPGGGGRHGALGARVVAGQETHRWAFCLRAGTPTGTDCVPSSRQSLQGSRVTRAGRAGGSPGQAREPAAGGQGAGRWNGAAAPRGVLHFLFICSWRPCPQASCAWGSLCLESTGLFVIQFEHSLATVCFSCHVLSCSAWEPLMGRVLGREESSDRTPCA